MLFKLITLFQLNLLDILSTKVILNLGGREGNPLVAYLFTTLGFWPTAALKLTWVALLCLALWKLRDHSWVAPAVSLSIAVYMALLGWHGYMLGRLL